METLTKSKKYRIETVSGSLFQTDNYDLFKTTVGNRPISNGLVKKIYKSICDNGWIESSVIVVGEGMRVLDGQHRIEALRLFKQEFDVAYKVRYMVDRELDNITKIQAFNENKATWSAMDYLHSYIAQGNEHYADYRTFMQSYKLTHTSALTLVSVGEKPHVVFKAGKFACNDWSVAKMRAERINEIARFFPSAKTQPFIRAIIQYWKHPEFDHKKFLHKLSMDREMLYRVGTTEQYVSLIERAYNYHSHEKIRFNF